MEPEVGLRKSLFGWLLPAGAAGRPDGLWPLFDA